MKMIYALIALMAVAACSGSKKTTETGPVEVIQTNIDGKGIAIQVEFLMGESHNHPLMAIWVDDEDGSYIETLFVAESIGKGVFQHGEKSKGQWEAGPVRRPAALPYWGHQRGVQAVDGLYIPTPDTPMPDAVTGPTPSGNFTLKSKTTANPAKVFRLMLEINQSWDWNEYWTNSKYHDDKDYKTSSQPSLVYEAVIDLDSPVKEYNMIPVGHGHYSGKDGSLTTDISTLTTALSIAKSIKVKLD
jgi:hypothetical protein